MDDHEAHALRAYFLWESEGCPDGRDLEHWFSTAPITEPEPIPTPTEPEPIPAPTEPGIIERTWDAISGENYRNRL